MEKIVYVGVEAGRRRARRTSARALLGDRRGALLAHGARGLTVLLADDAGRAGPAHRAARSDGGRSSVWVDSALAARAARARARDATARLAGWLALESVPLANTRHVVPLGARIPGLYTVAFLEKPDALDYATWLARWQGDHTTVAIETQRTFLYVQNVLVRPLTADAPPWTAIVEEAFPAEAATDPMRFYAATTPEQLAAQQRRMMASCERFIDFARFETLPMSAYVLARPTF